MGRDDDTWGQVPVLYYLAEEKINQNDLAQYFQENLAKYKLPKAYYHVTDLPYTSTGKLQRSKVMNEGLVYEN